MRKLIVITLVALASIGCDSPEEVARSKTSTGAWALLPPPDGAPEGTVCWLWHRGIGESATSAAVCDFPEPECQ